MADAKDIRNGEEKASEDFSKVESKTHEIHEKIKDILESTTESVIEDLGFERNDKVAGVYGDGTTYGAGVEENQYNVIVTSRPRKFDSSKNMSHGHGNGTFEKQIFIGAKRVESQVDYEIKGKVLHLQYRSPEAGFFRGVDDDGNTFMVRKRISVPLKDADKTLKEEFKDAAEREVGYLTNTKLGVEDRLEKSTTSIVENLGMKKLTIKSLLEDELEFSKDNVNEEFDKFPTDEEPHIDAIKAKNTVDIEGGKSLLFDDEEEEKDLMEYFSDMEGNENFENALENEFGVRHLDDLTPAEIKDNERLQRVFDAIESIPVSEITTAGPAGAGAGRYDTKSFASAKRGKKSKGGKKSDVGAPYSIPVNDPIYQEEESLNESKKDKAFKETSYAKSKKSRPKVDKNWNIIPEDKDTNSSKPYTQVVKVDPDYHPLGMPFVKPNSKEEWERTSGVGTDHDKLERMGLAESDKDKHERLRKRKFSSETENKNKGVNKRYIVTERTTEEYEKERWKKLSLFSKFETIKEAEELNTVFDNIEDYNSFYTESKKEAVNESVKPKQENSEKTVEVEKPGTAFGITQKFYEKDFLNESKKFILDLNSMVFVPNPNAGK
jgi:hypothetical protein